MSSLALSAYVLIWPAIAAIVLLVLGVGLFRDIRTAKRERKDLV